MSRQMVKMLSASVLSKQEPFEHLAFCLSECRDELKVSILISRSSLPWTADEIIRNAAYKGDECYSNSETPVLYLIIAGN